MDLNLNKSCSNFAADTECGEQHCYQMCDNSSLYMYLKKLGFPGFSRQVEPEIRIFFALRHIPHIEGKFKTLTFKIGGLGAEIFVRNHKSIPIYNISTDKSKCCPNERRND